MTFETVLRNRKSVRAYTDRPIAQQTLRDVLAAGALAPSGKNGQPWRFIVVQKDKALLQKLAALTVYEPFVRTADALIVVFLKKDESYHYVKDAQAVGACIENMLLACTAAGLGACWIGEILNRDAFVKKLLSVDNRLDLMAVLCLGYPDPAGQTAPPAKKSPDELLLASL